MKLNQVGLPMLKDTLGKEALLSSWFCTKELFKELLWPTRCVLCDMLDTLLCHSCKVNLPYLDQLQSCPICGSAYGKGICTECNQFILDWKHLSSFPLDGCTSSTRLTPETRRIITCYKDRGEQRLAHIIASFMADSLPYSWKEGAALVPIPTRPSAKRERGFDHLEKIADHLSKVAQLPNINALSVSTRKDQRLLGGQARLRNMKNSFSLNQSSVEQLKCAQRIILVDDVMTTGATLFSAAEILRTTTSAPICGLTFARA